MLAMVPEVYIHPGRESREQWQAAESEEEGGLSNKFWGDPLPPERPHLLQVTTFPDSARGHCMFKP